MELQELRQKLSEAGFSEEVEAKIDEILEKAVASGSLSDEDRAKMMELIEIDIEAGILEADTMENMALMFDSFASEAESVAKSNDEEEDGIYAEADMEAKAIEDEITQLQSDEMPAEPVVPVVAPEAPIAPAEAVPQWNQPVEPVVPPAAPAAEAPVVAPWNQTVTETTTSTNQPAPFPGNPTEEVK